MRTKIMTTVNDLRTWVDERTSDCEGLTGEAMDCIVDTIRVMPGCPAWGEDFSEFLDRLPEDLIDLI